ncbi:MAG TPA: sulfatase-like hydrolase/transferase, partial [Acidimicrobiales bacterium]
MAEPRTESAEATRPPAWWRQALRSFVELLALTGLAVTQPLLDVFGQAPDFFVYREADRSDLIAFAVLVALVPAAILWTVEQLIGLGGESPRRITHLVFVGGLFVLFGLQSLKSADVASGPMLVALASVGGVVAVLAYRRWAGVRTWLAYLAISPLLFVGLFLTTSEAADLLESQEVAAAEVAPVEDPPSVVLLQFDEWPLSTLVNGNGQIDRRLYPNLAGLAGDGVWYRNATTAATFTTYAVPAVLTGRQPDGERSAIASEYPESLFTLVGGQFDLDVIESVTHLCPTNLCDGELVDGGAAATAETTASEPPSSGGALGQLLTDARQTYQAMVSPDPDATAPAATFQEAVAADGAAPPTTVLDPEGAAAAARTTTTTTAPPGPPETVPGGGTVPPGGFAVPPMFSLQSVEETIAGIEEGEDPTLHFVHLLLPHTPYKFLPGGRQYSQDSGGLSAPLPQAPSGRPDQAAAVDLEHQRLLLQASYADRVVGQVMDRLRETGLYDDAIVVVVADHGIGLQPGGAIRAPVGEELAATDYADLFYVPLIVKAPGLDPPGTVTDANVMTIDILPTIAAALGIEMPWPVDGIDLATETRS